MYLIWLFIFSSIFTYTCEVPHLLNFSTRLFQHLTALLLDPTTKHVVVGGFDGYLKFLDEKGQVWFLLINLITVVPKRVVRNVYYNLLQYTSFVLEVKVLAAGLIVAFTLYSYRGDMR